MYTPHPLSEHLPPPWNFILPYAANLFAWGVLIGLIYLLRSFFLLIFLTFVFAYLQVSVGQRLEPVLPGRILRVVVVALTFILVLTAAGLFLAPKVKAQTEIFVSQFGVYVNRVDEELYRLAAKYPVLKEIMPLLSTDQDEGEKVKLPELLPSREMKREGNLPFPIRTPQPPSMQPHPPEAPQRKGLRDSPTAVLLQQLFGLGELGADRNLNHLIDTLSDVGGRVLTFTTNFLLSLLFSFLIVLDMPVLRQHVRGLAHTRLRFIYLAVADNIREFSLVLGRALEAQVIIAIVNSVLTAIGITVLGLGANVAFLSVIVFCFSFFPVVGVFISSIPICLVALQSQGLHTMLLAIVLIVVIHLIEGYILNPRVYGSYMRINSVITLIILTLAGKLVGFWGLLLGVPVCTYIFGYAIRLDRSPARSERKKQGKASSDKADEPAAQADQTEKTEKNPEEAVSEESPQARSAD